MKQTTLATAADQSFENYRKPTRRDEFLKTMEAIVPWSGLCDVIEPHYPKAGNGRPPIGLERMLRIHFIQHWFNLADLACEKGFVRQRQPALALSARPVSNRSCASWLPLRPGSQPASPDRPPRQTGEKPGVHPHFPRENHCLFCRCWGYLGAPDIELLVETLACAHNVVEIFNNQ